jgi:hypothetical protein
VRNPGPPAHARYRGPPPPADPLPATLRVQSWKKRWFVLTDKYIKYYKTEKVDRVAETRCAACVCRPFLTTVWGVHRRRT